MMLLSAGRVPKLYLTVGLATLTVLAYGALWALIFSEATLKYTHRVPGWSNGRRNYLRRGEYLVLSDSICRNMTPPTNRTDVKSYPGVRVEEMTDLLDHFPAIVAGYSTIIIHIGTNNLRDFGPSLTASTAQEIHGFYKEMCRTIRSINPKCVLIASAILPRPLDNSTTHNTLTEVNSLLKATFGSRFIQSGNGYTRLIPGNVERKMEFTAGFFDPDGVHLTDSGKNFLSEKFRNRLKG